MMDKNGRHGVGTVTPQASRQPVIHPMNEVIKPPQKSISTAAQPEDEDTCDVNNDNSATLELASGTSLFVSSGCPPMKWSQAVDFCQSNMMSVVSLGPSISKDEVLEVLAVAQEIGIKGFWTGGYVNRPGNPRFDASCGCSASNILLSKR